MGEEGVKGQGGRLMGVRSSGQGRRYGKEGVAKGRQGGVKGGRRPRD